MVILAGTAGHSGSLFFIVMLKCPINDNTEQARPTLIAHSFRNMFHFLGLRRAQHRGVSYAGTVQGRRNLWRFASLLARTLSSLTADANFVKDGAFSS